MSEEILVNVTPRETRVAVIENGMLQELHIERGWRRGVVGNIYKGKVQPVTQRARAARGRTWAVSSSPTARCSRCPVCQPSQIYC